MFTARPADASAMAAVDAFGLGNQSVAAGLLDFGVWYWESDIWTQLSGVQSGLAFPGRLAGLDELVGRGCVPHVGLDEPDGQLVRVSSLLGVRELAGCRTVA